MFQLLVLGINRSKTRSSISSEMLFGMGLKLGFLDIQGSSHNLVEAPDPILLHSPFSNVLLHDRRCFQHWEDKLECHI